MLSAMVLVMADYSSLLTRHDVCPMVKNTEAAAVHVREEGEGPGLCANDLDEYTFSLQ